MIEEEGNEEEGEAERSERVEIPHNSRRRSARNHSKSLFYFEDDTLVLSKYIEWNIFDRVYM